MEISLKKVLSSDKISFPKRKLCHKMYGMSVTLQAYYFLHFFKSSKCFINSVHSVLSRPAGKIKIKN
jgi:hypothetical protein